ncbi:hypothetical protein XYCOK13_24580 [Xylanibacillus composti]|uniref:Uncharacterized protein n=1 Tax=Xylanibacillus composti TaxID=1572762 RepID=A0A8J4M2G1_9BACL|nr:hypothetical protein XYCOK13_24580 [Xylanibacillus composti]
MTLVLRQMGYGFFAVLLAFVSFFTGEMVTFVMLGFILMSLLNINSTLQAILQKMNHRD